MEFDWRALPTKGLLLLKAASFRVVARAALRKLIGTEGQLLVTYKDDSITLSLARETPMEEAKNDGTGARVLKETLVLDPANGRRTLHARRLLGTSGRITVTEGADEITVDIDDDFSGGTGTLTAWVVVESEDDPPLYSVEPHVFVVADPPP